MKQLNKYLFALLTIVAMSTATSCEKEATESTQRKGRPHNPPPPSCGRIYPNAVISGLNYSVSGQYFNMQFYAVDSFNVYTLYIQQATIIPDGEIVDGIFYARASSGFGTPSIGVDMNVSPMDPGQTYTARVKCAISGTLCHKWSEPFTIVTTEAQSGERRGGNAPQPYTLIHTTPTDWSVSFDTSNCGTFILNWAAQPNKSLPGASNYYINVIGRPWNCAGSSVNTNVWYYIYGYGCSMTVGQTYNVQLSYFVNDDINRVTTYYYSDTVSVTTGSRGLWNCN